MIKDNEDVYDIYFDGSCLVKCKNKLGGIGVVIYKNKVIIKKIFK